MSRALCLWEMEPAGVIFISRAVDVPDEGAFGGKTDSFRRWGLRGYGRYESLISTQGACVYLLQGWAGRGFPTNERCATHRDIQGGRKALRHVLCTKVAAWTLRGVIATVLAGSESVHEGSHPTWAGPTLRDGKPQT